MSYSAFVVALVAVAASTAAQPPSRPLDIHFTPTRQAVAEAMLDLAGTRADDVVYDLGSGDGRLVILAAQRHGAQGVGFELQPPLVALSRQSAIDAGVADRVRFVEADLREADLAPATVVLLYLSTSLTRELTSKLFRELRPGARIVSHQFRLADRPPDRSVTVEGADLYPGPCRDGRCRAAAYLRLLPANAAVTPRPISSSPLT